MSTAATPVYEWKDLNWREIEQRVWKLQKRIYRASGRGDTKAVHRLQRLLMRSRSARLLATRRVTQDNQGKKTAGVDGVKSVPPPYRLLLADNLRLPSKAQPTRRVWIPKPRSEEKRPLGIPTMRDRAAQALAKLALEPEWEARFEPNSYGFRPGRSCHDAIEAIFIAIRYGPKHVLDADIAKCFDRIDHDALLTKLHTYPRLRRAIKAWLKSGVMDGETLFPTTEGTPQGGVISPLLANVALHGLEETIRGAARYGTGQNRPTVIRYADDFVILHRDAAVIADVRDGVETWLKGMKLELKPSKTRVAHTLEPYQGEQPGFDFLGFSIRQHRVGKTHSGTWMGRTPLGFKTIISPSPESVAAHRAMMKEVIKRGTRATQDQLVQRLNPKARGWAKYFSTSVARQTFNTADHELFKLLWRWAKRRHPRKNAHWIAGKYWRHAGRRHWTFGGKDGRESLLWYADTPVRRHTKVQGTRSPYDGEWTYWATRLGRHPEVPASVAKLLKKQQGKCAWCGLYFKEGSDLVESDHIVPTSQGGMDSYENRQALHKHCHDQKTARDIRAARGAQDKGHRAEEPCAVKVASTVLETSRYGDVST
jgi:RNA-directed DNA polymerase